jgi:hypothetical protein
VTSGASRTDFELAGRTVATELAAGAYERVLERFAPVEVKAMSADSISKSWSAVTKGAGPARVVAVETDLSTVDVTCELGTTKVVVRITFDGALRIRSLAFNPKH